jgi:sec-independent protein translocase protein TatA
MLNNIGLGGLLLICLVVLVMFGRGRIGGLMSELGSGISSFRRGLKAPEEPEPGVAGLDRPDRAKG